MSVLTELREIAEAATPGPWVIEDPWKVVRDLPDGTEPVAMANRMQDAAFACYFDPVTIAALLDVAEAAERAVTDRDEDPAVGVSLADALVDALARLREVTS